jgi:hypothetical protein
LAKRQLSSGEYLPANQFAQQVSFLGNLSIRDVHRHNTVPGSATEVFQRVACYREYVGGKTGKLWNIWCGKSSQENIGGQIFGVLPLPNSESNIDVYPVVVFIV